MAFLLLVRIFLHTYPYFWIYIYIYRYICTCIHLLLRSLLSCHAFHVSTAQKKSTACWNLWMRLPSKWIKHAFNSQRRKTNELLSWIQYIIALSDHLRQVGCLNANGSPCCPKSDTPVAAACSAGLISSSLHVFIFVFCHKHFWCFVSHHYYQIAEYQDEYNETLNWH